MCYRSITSNESDTSLYNIKPFSPSYACTILCSAVET